MVQHSFHARAVARAIIEQAEANGHPLNRFFIYKLVHLAHMRFKAQHGQALVAEPFEDWKYGPIVVDLFHDLKIFGPSKIESDLGFIPIWVQLPEDAVEARQSIAATLDEFGQAPLGVLVQASLHLRAATFQ